MPEGKSLGKFFVYCGLLLVFFLVMVPVVFSFSGRLIRAEVLIFLFLLFLALIGFIGYKGSWGERLLFFVFLIALGNAVFIWYFTSRLFMLPLFLAAAGFLMSLPKREKTPVSGRKAKKEKFKIEPYGEDEAKEEERPEEEPASLQYLGRGAAKRAKERKVRTQYSPGKYLASLLGKVYHVPSCDWAKKIAEERRVWFEDKREAKSKGYLKHDCVR